VDEVEEANEEDYDSGGSGVALTPPDSPRVPSYMAANGALIDPEKDIYAIPSRASSQKREIYFLALVDILTQYGMYYFLYTVELSSTSFLQTFRLQLKFCIQFNFRLQLNFC
jgi:hypothetical protein